MVKYLLLWASVVAQSLKNLPAGQETWVGSLGWEDPWRRAWQSTPVFLSRESPWTEQPGWPQSMESQRVRHDWVTKHSTASLRSLWDYGLYSISCSKPLRRWNIYIKVKLNHCLNRKLPQYFKSNMCCVMLSRSVLSDSSWHHGL